MDAGSGQVKAPVRAIPAAAVARAGRGRGVAA